MTTKRPPKGHAPAKGAPPRTSTTKRISIRPANTTRPDRLTRTSLVLIHGQREADGDLGVDSALLDALFAAVVKLGEDEIRVLAHIAERLVGGAKAYGALHIATDKRDWRKERNEELADAVVYSALESLRRDLDEREYLARFLAALQPERKPVPAYADDGEHIVSCRVCRVRMRAGEPALFRAWRAELHLGVYAHPACGWFRTDELAPHEVTGPSDRFVRWEWACPRPTCLDVVVAENPPSDGADLRCGACRSKAGVGERRQ